MSHIDYAVALRMTRFISLTFLSDQLVSFSTSFSIFDSNISPCPSAAESIPRTPLRRVGRHGRRGLRGRRGRVGRRGPSASVVLPSRRNTNDFERIEGLRGAGTS